MMEKTKKKIKYCLKTKNFLPMSFQKRHVQGLSCSGPAGWSRIHFTPSENKHICVPYPTNQIFKADYGEKFVSVSLLAFTFLYYHFAQLVYKIESTLVRPSLIRLGSLG